MNESLRAFEDHDDLRRYAALLEITDFMVHYSTMSEMIDETARCLKQVTEFQWLNLSIHDSARKVMRLHVWQGGDSPIAPSELPVEDAASGWVMANQNVFRVDDLREENRFPRVFGPLKAAGFCSFVMLPLTTTRKHIGALGFARRSPGAYTEGDVRLLRRIAELVALAIENVQIR